MDAYSTGKIVGIFVGVLVGILIVACILRYAKGKNLRSEYDERQTLVCGKAYKISYFIVLIGCGILTLLGGFLNNFIGLPILIFALICISVAFYAVYCILNDAYYGLKDKPKKIHIAFAIIAAVNLFSGIVNIMEYGVDLTDPFPTGFLNLICAALFIVIFIAIAIKAIIDKKEA